ncbi:MAG TPA: DinB family protein [Symbiobacteriaceae bacterium]|jgi:uncharacterized damage-inducible protein DinB
MRIDLVIPPDLTGHVAGTVGPLEFGRQRLKATLEGLTPEQLSQVPTGLANSIATIAVHICATEANMAYRLMAQPLPDDLKAEFLLNKGGTGLLPEATGETVESLTAKMDRSREMLIQVLGRISDGELDRELEFTGGRHPTVRWALALLPNHQAQHLGQIQMIKKLLK